MDYTTFFLTLGFILVIMYVLMGRRNSGIAARLPPGPYPFPIIGSILKLGQKPHHALAALSKIYGPLMSLKLGSTTTIVVSSPETAKEFFLTHDLSFSSRAVPDAARIVNHSIYSVIWLPVGDQWRLLRKLCKEHLFSTQQLDAGQLLRREKLHQLVEHVRRCCVDGKAVNIGQVAFTTSLNVLSNFISSTDMASYDSVASQEFRDTVSALMEIAGKPNLADFFPILKPLDPQGLLREGNLLADKLMAILEEMVNRRVHLRANSPTKSNDVLDLLLDESILSRNDIPHLFLDLFSAGAETTSNTIEWAMTELLRNPEKLAKARSELEGMSLIIEESDVSKLPYLRAIVKETFRLHPPGPFLVPHKALLDVEVCGFIVPKDAQILCNVWAIGRDPTVWLEPETFMPERFLDVDIDYKGRDFELIPFGSGRRICLGLSLADRMLLLTLAYLIRKFEWKLEGDARIEDMDMSERFGITLQKKIPLMLVPTHYNSV